jgi:hypothetical protein
MGATSILILSPEVPGTKLAQISRDFRRDLSRSGFHTQPVQAASGPNERGDAFTLG